MHARVYTSGPSHQLDSGLSASQTAHLGSLAHSRARSRLSWLAPLEEYVSLHSFRPEQKHRRLPLPLQATASYRGAVTQIGVVHSGKSAALIH